MIMIDIEMPEKCGECPRFHAEHPMHCQLIKPPNKNKRLVAPYGLPRPDWCPLLNVENVKASEVGMNEIFEPYDVECNTCKHYDPMNGICRITGNYHHGYDDCNAINNDHEEMWEEWDGGEME